MLKGVFLKKDRECYSCEAPMKKGARAVFLLLLLTNPYSGQKFWKASYYHLDCYIESVTKRLQNQWEEREMKEERKKHTVRRPRGRPSIICIDWKRRRQITALLYYHRRQLKLKRRGGNPHTDTHIDRIKELEAERYSLTIGGQHG